VILERAKGFEPSTPTLARLCSISQPVGLRPTASQDAMRRARLADRADREAIEDRLEHVRRFAVYLRDIALVPARVHGPRGPDFSEFPSSDR